MLRQTIRAILTFALCLTVGQVAAQEKALTLAAPSALTESGYLRYVLPRFSLKTSIRILMTEDAGQADVVLGTDLPLPGSRALITDLRDGTTYDIAATGAETPGAEHVARFLDWLGSDVGQRTLDGHRLNEAQIFTVAATVEEAAAPQVLTGDLALGEELSLLLCGRCHVVNEKNRQNGIGSAPSFPALKALRDWDTRFQVFYTLNPHPSFTQIEGITDPFDPARPSPIAPIEMDVDELEAMLAYVTSLTPLDLGAQIELK